MTTIIWMIVIAAATLIAWLVGVATGAGFGFRRALYVMRSIAQKSGPIEYEIILRLADYMEKQEGEL